MLSLRPMCEFCGRHLSADSADARICSYECTFCAGCSDGPLQGRCPNCAGELLPRPRRLARSDATSRNLTVANHGLTIALAEPDDLDDLAPLFDQYRVFYEQPSDQAGARQFLQSRMARRQSTILIARREHAAVGFCQLYPIFSSVSMQSSWLLNDLFVNIAGRRHGVGRHLLNAARAFAQAQGAGWLMLQTHRENHTAQGLYQSSGWVRDDEFLTYFAYPEQMGQVEPG
jgi:GNAT superfamily N-acetyltransferase